MSCDRSDNSRDVAIRSETRAAGGLAELNLAMTKLAMTKL
ncbi:hypothetical protein J2X36_001245 [Methylobacterium sp. BE186]|nr:hypothetical protein [Methylobacterium sp. BE186]